MRFFSSELGHEYAKTQTCGYCNYGLLEIGDTISDMYAKGYLPYSGSPDSKGMFYMTRSGRLHLADYELDSECRRITKKFDGKYTREVTPFSGFRITDEFIIFWLEYYLRAHGAGILTRERLMHWLNFGIITHISAYKDTNGKIGGYALEVSDNTMTHDWQQSYAEELDKQSFGVWLLIDIAREAKKAGKQYYYPGTVYAENSYKTNFPSLEYWNGTEWIVDPKNRALKDRLETDSARHIPFTDEWKQNHPLF